MGERSNKLVASFKWMELVEAQPRIRPDTGAAMPETHRPAIVVGEFKVSIQASEYHYCSPRVTGRPLDAYDSYEVAIWRGDCNWISTEEYIKLGLGDSSDDVRGWVSGEIIEKALIALGKGALEDE